MGCCGCSLVASALTAVVLGLVESIIGMCWNILVVVVISTYDRTENATSLGITVTTTEATTIDGDEPSLAEAMVQTDNSTLGGWEEFKLTLVSEQALNSAHIFELTVAALVLNSFWLITTLALAVGNAEKCRGMLKPWIFTTVVITILDIAATVYFIFKAVEDTEGQMSDIHLLFVNNIFVILATLFSRGGPLIWVTNIALCIFVAQRVKEIEVLKKKRLPFDSDMRISPYALHIPYEAESYRWEKSSRPTTPPPDYEAYAGRGNGAARKGNFRRQSLPSEGDNSTLPVSLRSAGSTMPRPASACYVFDDDRVELQHRTSAITSYHAYENRALQLDHAKGLSIPRPKLTISR